MEQRKLIEQLIKASNEISKNTKPTANYNGCKYEK